MIGQQVPNTGSFDWTIPADSTRTRLVFPVNARYAIRVTVNGSEGMVGYSDVSDGTIHFTAPITEVYNHSSVTASIWDAVRSYLGR